MPSGLLSSTFQFLLWQMTDFQEGKRDEGTEKMLPLGFLNKASLGIETTRDKETQLSHKN